MLKMRFSTSKQVILEGSLPASALRHFLSDNDRCLLFSDESRHNDASCTSSLHLIKIKVKPRSCLSIRLLINLFGIDTTKPRLFSIISQECCQLNKPDKRSQVQDSSQTIVYYAVDDCSYKSDESSGVS